MPFKILNKDLDYTYFAHEFKDNLHFNYISDEIGPAILSISVAAVKDSGDQCQMFALLRTDKVNIVLLLLSLLLFNAGDSTYLSLFRLRSTSALCNFSR